MKPQKPTARKPREWIVVVNHWGGGGVIHVHATRKDYEACCSSSYEGVLVREVTPKRRRSSK